MNKFLIKQFGKRNKFLKQLEFKNYSEYLNSETWYNIKRHLKKELKYQYCCICYSSEKIELHHINYNLLYHSHIKRDIFSLCEKCHKEVHKMSLSSDLSLKAAIKKLGAEKYEEAKQQNLLKKEQNVCLN